MGMRALMIRKSVPVLMGHCDDLHYENDDITHYLRKIEAVYDSQDGSRLIARTEEGFEFIVVAGTKVGDFINTETGSAVRAVTAIVELTEDDGVDILIAMKWSKS